jgi:hypothetical protein
MLLEKSIHKFLSLHLVRGEWYERKSALSLLNYFNENRPNGIEYTNFLISLEKEANPDEEQTLAERVASDILNDLIHELASINTKHALPLKSWLSRKIKDDAPIGDLAFDAMRDNGFPETGNLEEYLGVCRI